MFGISGTAGSTLEKPYPEHNLDLDSAPEGPFL